MLGFIFITAFSILFYRSLFSNLNRVKASRTEKIVWNAVWSIFTALLLFAQYMSVTGSRAKVVSCHSVFQASKTASDSLHNLLHNRQCWSVLNDEAK